LSQGKKKVKARARAFTEGNTKMSTQSTTKPVLVKIVIAEIAAEIAQAAEAAREKVKGQRRWTTAINKAEQWLLARPATVQYHPETHTLLMQSKDRFYFANGSCQCEAYKKDNPCYHRAASRLITRALELAAAKAAPAPVAEAPAAVATRGPNEGTGTIDDLFN